MFGWKVRTRRQWNKYCLWVALVGGNLAGIVCFLPALSVILGASTWLPTWSRQITHFYVLPLVYSTGALAQAPRRRLLWIFVPSLLWLFWSVTDRIVTRNWPGLIHDLHGNIIVAGMGVFFGCLLPAIQGKFGRGLEEEDTATEPVNHFEASEDVWPPPPRRAE